jgi:hypothetical protein
MLRVEIPDDLLIRAVSDAVERQLARINDFSGYVDLKGACKFLSVGESQFKEWVRLGYIHPRKISSHLVRYRVKELEAFMEDFLVKSRAKPPRDCIERPPVPDSSLQQAG